MFPGLIYRMLKPKVVLLIFVSGKIVLTGAKVSMCQSPTIGDGVTSRVTAIDMLAHRSERKFTPLSIRYIPCCASSGNHEFYSGTDYGSSTILPVRLIANSSTIFCVARNGLWSSNDHCFAWLPETEASRYTRSCS